MTWGFPTAQTKASEKYISILAQRFNGLSTGDMCIELDKLKTKNMRKVIMIDEPKEGCIEPIKFRKYLCPSNGLIPPTRNPSEFKRIVYLGYHETYGDMFAAYDAVHINIYTGHLNSGTY